MVDFFKSFLDGSEQVRKYRQVFYFIGLLALVFHHVGIIGQISNFFGDLLDEEIKADFLRLFPILAHICYYTFVIGVLLLFIGYALDVYNDHHLSEAQFANAVKIIKNGADTMFDSSVWFIVICGLSVLLGGKSAVGLSWLSFVLGAMSIFFEVLIVGGYFFRKEKPNEE